jgi:leucine dehydrogenase
LGAKFVALEDIYDLDCDIFSPCARGAILNEVTIPKLKYKAVVGAANNQLATPQDGIRLHERGILYAPDFAVNSGGIINIFVESQGYDQKKALKKTEEIYLTMKEVFERSKRTKKPTFEVADHLAEERLYGKK